MYSRLVKAVCTIFVTADTLNFRETERNFAPRVNCRSVAARATPDDKQIRYISCRERLLADNSLFIQTRLDCFYSERSSQSPLTIRQRVQDSSAVYMHASVTVYSAHGRHSDKFNATLYDPRIRFVSYVYVERCS